MPGADFISVALGAAAGLAGGRRLAPVISAARLQPGFAVAQALLAVALLFQLIREF